MARESGPVGVWLITMTIDPPILIAVSALIGALLTAVWNRSTKRLELVYAKKADAYRT
jgi:hypothetical protein